MIKLFDHISIYNIYASIYTGFFKDLLQKKYLKKSNGRENTFTHQKFWIWNTPHQDYLNGSPLGYLEYISRTQQLEHGEKQYSKLIVEYLRSEKFNQRINLSYYQGDFMVLDGLHRLVIVSQNGKKNIGLNNFLLEDFQYDEISKINLAEYESEIKNQVSKYKNSYFKSNGWGVSGAYEAGYHSINNFGLNISGQRDCKKRVKDISAFIDLNDKAIVDFGCNTGGMLFSVERPAYCLGIDYDRSAIAVAEKILGSIKKFGAHEFAKRYKFLVMNFDKTNYEKLACSIKNANFDVAILGSLGSWVKSWKILYAMAFQISNVIIFEENNAAEGLEQIKFFESLGGMVTKIIEGSPDDASGNDLRNTYLVKKLIKDFHRV